MKTKILISIAILLSTFSMVAQNEKHVFDVFYTNGISFALKSEYAKTQPGYSFNSGINYNYLLLKSTYVKLGAALYSYNIKYDFGKLPIYGYNEFGDYVDDCKQRFICIPLGLNHQVFDKFQLSCGIMPTYYFRNKIKKTIIFSNGDKIENTDIKKHKLETTYIKLGGYISLGYIHKLENSFDLGVSLEFNLSSISYDKYDFYLPYIASFGLKTSLYLHK